jgi:hypothetical protein
MSPSLLILNASDPALADKRPLGETASSALLASLERSGNVWLTDLTLIWSDLVKLSGRLFERLMMAIKRQTAIGRGKRSTVAVTAVARELAGFIWALGQVR